MDRFQGRWQKILMGAMIFCAIATPLNFLGLAIVLHGTGVQAHEGQKARDTQCRVFPVSVKLYAAAAKYKLISPADLRTYLSARPKGCPTPGATP